MITDVDGGVVVLVIWYPICVDVNGDIEVVGNVEEPEVGNPLIQEALMLLFGNETVPPETVKPLLNVCKALHVFCVAEVIKPLIAEELILLFGNETVPAETLKPLANVCKALHVFCAVEVIKPLIAEELILLFGNIIVPPVTLKPKHLNLYQMFV